MIFTDPPYGHNNNNGDLIHKRESALGKGQHGEARPIMNDGREIDDLIRRAFKEFNRLIPKGGACCCCGGGGPKPMFANWSLWLDEAIGFKQMVVWDKGPMGMGWHYRRSYETVLVAEKKGAKSKWYDETSAVENIIRSSWHGVKKIIPSAEQHPTEKPHTLSKYFIRLHTMPGEIVFDPFMGSGSTGIGALDLQRKFIGIELDPKWFDVACERIERAQRQKLLFSTTT